MNNLATNESSYVCHMNTPENSNTIITILYEKIQEICRHHSPKELTISFDNHATGKSYLLLAFFEALVTRWQLLDTVRLFYYIRGHSVNAQDVSNEPTSRAFYAMSGYEWLVNPVDVCAVINSHTNKNVCEYRTTFFDWSSALVFDSKQLSGGISDQHVYQIDREGIQVKEFVESVWRGPYRILQQVKLPPALAKIPPLSAAEIKALVYYKDSFHWKKEDMQFVEELIAGKCYSSGILIRRSEFRYF